MCHVSTGHAGVVVDNGGQENHMRGKELGHQQGGTQHETAAEHSAGSMAFDGVVDNGGKRGKELGMSDELERPRPTAHHRYGSQSHQPEGYPCLELFPGFDAIRNTNHLQMNRASKDNANVRNIVQHHSRGDLLWRFLVFLHCDEDGLVQTLTSAVFGPHLWGRQSSVSNAYI
ncbi:unnamed protein product [Arctogadus glacialis]